MPRQNHLDLGTLRERFGKPYSGAEPYRGPRFLRVSDGGDFVGIEQDLFVSMAEYALGTPDLLRQKISVTRISNGIVGEDRIPIQDGLEDLLDKALGGYHVLNVPIILFPPGKYELLKKLHDVVLAHEKNS